MLALKLLAGDVLSPPTVPCHHLLRLHTPLVNACLSRVSHRNHVMSDETEFVTEHRNRPHGAYAGGQQIPALVAFIEGQHIGLTIYFESQFTTRLSPFAFRSSYPLSFCSKGRTQRPFLSEKRIAKSEQRYFFSSTSTYSASITPSSFFFSSWASPFPPGAGPPGGGCCAEVALYIASASLCEADVRFSRALFIAGASVPSSAFLASARAFSTSA